MLFSVKESLAISLKFNPYTYPEALTPQIEGIKN